MIQIEETQMSENIKLKDKIYDKVLNEITEGYYQQNQIITERELIEKYGVSKSPVREALIELCNEKCWKAVREWDIR